MCRWGGNHNDYCRCSYCTSGPAATATSDRSWHSNIRGNDFRLLLQGLASSELLFTTGRTFHSLPRLARPPPLAPAPRTSLPPYLPPPTSPTCEIPKWAQHFRQMTLSCGLYLEQETSKSIFAFNRKKKKKSKKSPDTIYYTVTTYRKPVISKKGARQQQKNGEARAQWFEHLVRQNWPILFLFLPA